MHTLISSPPSRSQRRSLLHSSHLGRSAASSPRALAANNLIGVPWESLEEPTPCVINPNFLLSPAAAHHRIPLPLQFRTIDSVIWGPRSNPFPADARRPILRDSRCSEVIYLQALMTTRYCSLSQIPGVIAMIVNSAGSFSYFHPLLSVSISHISPPSPHLSYVTPSLPNRRARARQKSWRFYPMAEKTRPSRRPSSL